MNIIVMVTILWVDVNCKMPADYNKWNFNQVDNINTSEVADMTRLWQANNNIRTGSDLKISEF